MRKAALLNLIKNNLSVEGKRFEVKAETNGDATVYLYDVIDNWFGINSEEFAKQLLAIDASTIHLRIDSPGGDVFDARAIYTQIKQHPARVVAHIDGLCASAATYIALAADEIEMTDGAMFMIHKGWTTTIDNADGLRKTAELLDKVDDAIANDYHKKTGLEKPELLAWMGEEKWMNAQEAKALGFIDRIFDEGKASARADRFDLSAYANAPAPQPAPLATEPKPVFNARTPLYQRLTELHETVSH